MAVMSRVCPVTAVVLLLLRDGARGSDVTGVSGNCPSVAVAEVRGTWQ